MSGAAQSHAPTISSAGDFGTGALAQPGVRPTAQKSSERIISANPQKHKGRFGIPKRPSKADIEAD